MWIKNITTGKVMKNISAVIFYLDDTLLDRSKTFSLYCEYLIDNFLKTKYHLMKKKIFFWY
jgi:hypothetical protein